MTTRAKPPREPSLGRRSLLVFAVLAGLGTAGLLLFGLTLQHAVTLFSASSPALSGLSVRFCQAVRRARDSTVTSHARKVGWGLGVSGAALLLTRATDPSYLFFSYPEQAEWLWQGNAWQNAHYGLKLLADGTFETVAKSHSASLAFAPGRLAACLAVVPFGIAVPMWLSVAASLQARLWAVVTAALLLNVLMHAVAAGRASALLLPTASAPLLLHSWICFRAQRAASAARPDSTL